MQAGGSLLQPFRQKCRGKDVSDPSPGGFQAELSLVQAGGSPSRCTVCVSVEAVGWKTGTRRA